MANRTANVPKGFSYPRGTCPVCYHEVPFNKNGLPRSHGFVRFVRPRCRGSYP